MLPERKGNAHLVFIVDHPPIIPYIYPVPVTLFRDYSIEGAQVTAAVMLVPERNRELREKIYFITFYDILFARSGRYNFRFDRAF
ncbi:MAG: hypothetical protein A4E57_04080 [Syntrophorhabdaceae bacterium PtaU1.Bin034]|nr:MAG: hypothetical protein A4E57_04080 [Syntrophorhabdaceae bacterium PtaU1.Bin034]